MRGAVAQGFGARGEMEESNYPFWSLSCLTSSTFHFWESIGTWSSLHYLWESCNADPVGFQLPSAVIADMTFSLGADNSVLVCHSASKMLWLLSFPCSLYPCRFICLVKKPLYWSFSGVLGRSESRCTHSITILTQNPNFPLQHVF